MASKKTKKYEMERIRAREPISVRGQELGRYIKELYTSGAKLWTKDMFRDIELQLGKKKLPSTVIIRGINGVLEEIMVPQVEHDPDRPYDPERWWDIQPQRLNLHFQHYQQMVYDAETEQHRRYGDESVELDEVSIVSRSLLLSSIDETTSFVEYPDLQVRWKETWHIWTESPVCQQLTELLKKAPIPKCKQLVCLGLGSLESSPEGYNSLASDGLLTRRCMTQHAAALTISAVLGKRFDTSHKPLPILAQDPEYTSVQKRLLKEIGVEVIDGRGTLAFTYIDEYSVVFSVSPNVPVKQVVADIAKPAAMIWDRVMSVNEEITEFRLSMIEGDEVEITPWLTDEDSPRTRALVKDYLEFDFPTDKDRFGDIKIYLRKY